MIKRCRQALRQVLEEHNHDSNNLRKDVTIEKSAVYFAGRMAMIAMEALNEIGDMSLAETSQSVFDTITSAGTALSIVVADQLEFQMRT
jgi:hypothetical protein